ncbi:UV-stimulated scaffold protein A [Xenopus tropicalis]|uniref:UV-stimulated scaffold protein A n=1 Tax=Xenopus tropicalis TaxID=8364 RepID=UPI0001614583|nr:UV-stimulated scaffold protein A [Xenopus tropicalis]AAI55702.1 LOC100135095 protein [Xenopus tropicalis]|eukprot:NP_001107306.1 UV-stimulated scaffold protein A [Xenopus tropicalis]
MDQKLSELVEVLTTSGEPQLNPEKLKELKKICRSSDEHINHVYHLLMTQLNQEHAEIRLSAFQIVTELFARSHLFRTLLISNFQEFLELTVETDHEQPLPPPKEVAQKMKILAIKTVQEWHEKFGEAYKKLSLGYHFLKQNKKIDFQDVRSRTQAERKREEEKQRRLENIYKEKVKKATAEMEDMLEEIQSSLTEMENCFRLLLPDPREFVVFTDEKDFASDMRTKPTSQSPSHSKSTSQSSAYSKSTSQVSFDNDDEQPCCSKNLPPFPSSCTSSASGAERSLGEGAKESDKSARKSDTDDSDGDYEGSREAFLRDHGLGSHAYSLSLEISTDLKVNENENNTDVLNNLMDAHKLLKQKYWPAVQSWIQLFTKAGTNSESLKCAIDVKKEIEAALKKYKEMNIDCHTRERKVMTASDDDDDDDEFEEVPEKEGYEPHIPDHLREEYGLEPSASKQPGKKTEVKRPNVPQVPPSQKRINDELNPTCAAATMKTMKDKMAKALPGSSRNAGEPKSKCPKRETDPSQAPVAPCGLDLHHWGEEQPSAGKMLKFSSLHRFWAPNEVDEEVESKELEALVKTRYVTLPGKFEPVKHKCLAPMPNGSLCERQDRYKCPFHGKIVPRDAIGVPINAEDRAREAREKFEKQGEEQDWRDPELMREIEQATGVDLGSSKCPVKGKGKGVKRNLKKKYPNLTDLKQKANTSRSRLEKKVFNTGSVKRVISAMNQADKRRHEKFANQFNYALN